MEKLFGTDGIRGKAYEYPMTFETVVKIGKAIAFLFHKEKMKIVIGKDTRESGNMLEQALVSGICDMGADVYLTGVLPTPGIAHIASSLKADAGIVVSASHNPYDDNGIKIFQTTGIKLPDEKENEIETVISSSKLDSANISASGNTYILEDAAHRYTDFLKQSFPTHLSLKGIKIIMDCANGATYKVAPEVFTGLGAYVEPLFIEPDGKNINDHCGSQYPETLKKRVCEAGADIGLAFDGDGDRLIAVDEKGAIATGDQILAVCAKFMKQKGILKNNVVVSTIMSNIGLGLALDKMGIKHVMANVGDRFVREEMIKNNAVIGGEDSGHMIFLDYHSTGDGILAALRLLEAMISAGEPLSNLLTVMKVFPQKLINVEVKTKPDIQTIPEIAQAIKTVEKKLGNKGRVLVRYSGTQPLCRIMVEGPSESDTLQYCEQLSDIIKLSLG